MAFLGGFFDPPASKVPTPQITGYTPSGMNQAEGGVLSGVGNLGQYNTYGQYLPQAQDITQNLVNNPYAGGYQQGSGVAGQLGQQSALNAYGQGQNLYGMAGNIANTAFDPQQALYNRTLQQTQDQSRAANEAAGVGTTPYGAGLENQATNNFNINWQAQQLANQIAGGNAAGGLTQQGAGLQAGAAGQYGTAAGMPYQAAQTIGGNQFGALQNLGGFGTSASQIPQQQIQDYQNYLGWGTGQNTANNQAQLGLGQFGLNQAQQGFNQQQTMFNNLGNALGTGAALLL